jgi:hypothetical protein
VRPLGLFAGWEHSPSLRTLANIRARGIVNLVNFPSEQIQQMP